MKKHPEQTDQIYNLLKTKACTKQAVFRKAKEMFAIFKEVLKETAEELNDKISSVDSAVEIKYTDKGEFEAEIKFSGDVLIFNMHTNVFSFDPTHDIYKSSYVKKDRLAAYCGMINMYNFLADSFRYNRVRDSGFLLGRVFVNKDAHFFTEGKRQFGFMYNDFINDVLDKDSIKSIVETAIIYGLEFDLMTPNFNDVREVTVYQMQNMSNEFRIKTSKQLGFRFSNEEE